MTALQCCELYAEFFPLNTLNISFYSSLACMVSYRSSVMFLTLYLRFFFSFVFLYFSFTSPLLLMVFVLLQVHWYGSSLKKISFYGLLLYLGMETHLTVFKAYSWLCIEGSFLTGIKMPGMIPYRMPGIKAVLTCCNVSPVLCYYIL